MMPAVKSPELRPMRTVVGRPSGRREPSTASSMFTASRTLASVCSAVCPAPSRQLLVMVMVVVVLLLPTVALLPLAVMVLVATAAALLHGDGLPHRTSHPAPCVEPGCTHLHPYTLT